MPYKYVFIFLFITILCEAQQFEISKIEEGLFELIVINYDSVSNLKSGLNDFYYNSADKPNGRLLVKNEENKIVRECEYLNGKMGIDKWWHSSGEKEWFGDWNFTNNLKSYVRWYKNGIVKSEQDSTGLSAQYYENGQKKIERGFINGKLEGDYFSWFENGKMKERGRYKGGEKTGRWFYFNNDGSLKEEKIY
jgi:antitoxin component YwqK of YwqJK toxin-antitoxin module